MNNVKNKLQRILYVFMAIIAISLTTGCSNDDENEGGSEKKVVKSASYTISLTYPEDQLSLFDMKVEYTTPSGEKVSEPITGTWSKTLEFNSFPSTSSIVVTQTLKEGVTLTKETYKLGCEMNRDVKVLYSDGSKSQYDLSGKSFTLTVGADKIGQYAEAEKTVFKTSFTVSQNEDKSNIVVTYN